MPRLSIEDIKKKLSATDVECLEERYKNPHLKMAFRCKQGHEFKATWSYMQSYVKRKIACPVCKNGPESLNWQIEYGEGVSRNATVVSINRTQKEEREIRRRIRAHSNPHEITIDNLCNQIPNAKKYGFHKELIHAIARYGVIERLKEQEKIANNELLDESSLQKEIHKRFCSLCEAEEEKCDCGEETISEYEWAKQIVNGDCKSKAFLPDLYVIDEKLFKIKAIEVEDQNRVSIVKIANYAYFRDCLDWYLPEWEFELHVYDRFGNLMGFINLPLYFEASLRDDFDEKYKSYLEEIENMIPPQDSEIRGYYLSAKFSSW